MLALCDYMLALLFFCFFFFKQKTAYEIHSRLEFRRVLFRSAGTADDAVWSAQRVLGNPCARVRHRQLCRRCRLPFLCAGLRLRAQFEDVAKRFAAGRSEERRVGQECRAGWAPASWYESQRWS